jgi:translocation and assembly module TamB
MTPEPSFKTVLLRRLRRTGLFSLIVVALIFSSALAAMYFVLDTQHGTQWALRITHRLLPALSFTNAQGSLVRGMHFEQIRWRDIHTDVEVINAQLRLDFSHLFYGEAHLPILHIETVRITPLGPSSNTKINLPRIFLPFTLSTPDLTLQRLDIVNKHPANNDSIFSLYDLRGAIAWSASTLKFSETHLRWNDAALNANGSIEFGGDYPLKLQGNLMLSQWSGVIAVRSDGDLRRLELQARSERPYALKAQLKLATLDKNLPMQIHAELLEPVTQSLGRERIVINKALLDASGDLTQLKAHTALVVNDSRYGDSTLTANTRWQDQAVQMDAQWLPSTGNLQMHCDGTLRKPITANCNGNAAAISLTPWLAGQTAEISSAITLEVKWFDPQWALALTLPNLSGKFNNDAMTAAIDVHTDDGKLWQLRPSSLRIGPNELKGGGEFGKHYRLQAAIDARDVSRLHPQAAGAMTGNISIEGESPDPSVRAQLKGNLLQFQRIRATQAQLDIVLPKLGNESGHGQIEVHDLVISGATPVNLTFSISGSRAQQQWSLLAQQRTNEAVLRCITSSDKSFDDWQLSCPKLSGRLRSAINQDWRNSAVLRGRAQFNKRQFELAPLCLRGEDIELCLDQTLRYVDAKLQPFAMHAQGIPLRWIQPWLPDGLSLIGDARVSAQAQLKSIAPLDAQASADIPQTHWRWHTLTATETAEINAIHFDASLNEKRAFITTSAQSPTLGRIDAHLAIKDPRQQRELDGNIGIQQLQLAGFAWAFQGLDAIGGEINGSIGITGTTRTPQLHGQLLLKDGNALWAPLGAPFRTVNADLTFDNNSAKLGGWFALGQGGGDINGDISWDGPGNDWKLHLALIAGGVSAAPLPNSTIVFSPHTDLLASPGEIHIDGYIDVASAEIQLKELPPQTTDVSQDQEIAGQQPDEDSWKVWAKLGLNLGDQFHLNGFGADVNLSGRLQLTKAPDDNLHLIGEVKVPRGRYRAYGQRLTVRKGSVIFYGPFDNPDLNLEAVRDMPVGVNDVVGLRVIGSLKTPEALLFSEPSMPDSDIAYYLLTGHKPVAGTTGTSGYSASGALLSLGLAGSESRAGQLAEKFGITDLQLGTSETKNGQSEAEVSGQLGKDLYVRYGRGLGQQGNSISFQYRLTPRLMIETISGIEDALDLLYSFEVK